ncbi:PI-PLC X domain-containing protein [Rutstroemia sp. NJR-2017a BVV2]|nr:PI-PLC X domain-containing protein [Rutstroemia sp. NJR-2017a BVV2]
MANRKQLYTMRLLVLFPLLFAASTIASTIPQACNGYSALCSRKWSNISQIGTHDSAFVGISPFDNQAVDITKQLNAGIRFLQAQTHYFLGQLYLCHTSCILRPAGPLVDYLTEIKKWLDKNPNEVVTLLLTNGDRKSVSLFGGAITSSALNTYAYTPTKKLAIDEWPTLQEMITSGKRFVVFLDYLADTTLVPYVLDEFQYFFETAFDTTDSSFSSCDSDRPKPYTGSDLLPLINHYLDVGAEGILVPDRLALKTTNAATGKGSIGAQADLCTNQWKRKPRVMLVDFFDTGNVFAAQKTLNGLPLATSGSWKAISQTSNIISFFIVMLISLCAL